MLPYLKIITYILLCIQKYIQPNDILKFCWSKKQSSFLEKCLPLLSCLVHPLLHPDKKCALIQSILTSLVHPDKSKPAQCVLAFTDKFCLNVYIIYK